MSRTGSSRCATLKHLHKITWDMNDSKDSFIQPLRAISNEYLTIQGFDQQHKKYTILITFYFN